MQNFIVCLIEKNNDVLHYNQNSSLETFVLVKHSHTSWKNIIQLDLFKAFVVDHFYYFVMDRLMQALELFRVKIKFLFFCHFGFLLLWIRRATRVLALKLDTAFFSLSNSITTGISSCLLPCPFIYKLDQRCSWDIFLLLWSRNKNFPVFNLRQLLVNILKLSIHLSQFFAPCRTWLNSIFLLRFI